jgi:hypothetical protein
MIRGYANKGTADKSYYGAIADLLLRYPKIVALACADPFHGVVRETKFLPTPSDVIAWCEKRIHPLCVEADRESRIAEQLEAREVWEAQVIADGLKANGRAWLDRTDPKARQLIAAKSAEADARTDALMKNLDEANRIAFERECRADGIDPAGGVSPTLRKLLGASNVTRNTS